MFTESARLHVGFGQGDSTRRCGPRFATHPRLRHPPYLLFVPPTIARYCTLGLESSQRQLNSQFPFSGFDLTESIARQCWPRSRVVIRHSISRETREHCNVASGSLALCLSHSGVRIPRSLEFKRRYADPASASPVLPIANSLLWHIARCEMSVWDKPCY